MPVNTKKTALGLPDPGQGNPAEFDLNAWLNGATVPQRLVTVYADRAAADKVMRLWERIEEKRAELDARDPEAPVSERTLDDAGPETELAEMVHEFELLRPTLDASAQTFTMEPIPWKADRAINAALDAARAQAIKADKPMDDGDALNWVLTRRIHAAIVTPKITLGQFEKVRAAIGELQMWQFVHALNELSSADQGVDTDFSLPPSAHPSTTE